MTRLVSDAVALGVAVDHPLLQNAPASTDPGKITYVSLDPRAHDRPLPKMSPRTALKLLAASNGLHSHPVDGVPAAEPFTSRWACWFGTVLPSGRAVKP